MFNTLECMLFVTKPKVIGRSAQQICHQILFFAFTESKVTYCASAADG